MMRDLGVAATDRPALLRWLGGLGVAIGPDQAPVGDLDGRAADRIVSPPRTERLGHSYPRAVTSFSGRLLYFYR